MKWPRLIIAMMVGVGLLGSAMVLPARAQLRGEVPGSYLIFPEFNISPPAVTQLRISDIQDSALGGTTRVQLQYICPPSGGPGASGGTAGVCATTARNKVLTFHGTLIIDVATDLGGPFPGAPCNKGYVIAFVEDAAHHAISANQLIGSYRISGTDGDDAEAVNAIAVQSAKPPGTVLGSLDATGELVLTFGTTPTSDYVALPDVLFSDFQAVQASAVPPKRTQLIVLTPTIKAGLANSQANVGYRWWNQFEDEFSSTDQFSCWAEFELEAISGLLTAANLGSPFGSLQVESVTSSGGYSPAILGVIRETGPGPTLRRMYHTDTVVPSSAFGPSPGSTTPPPLPFFVDVPDDHPFSPWINALAASGITQGCGTNPPRFCPDLSVTRGEMAVFILRGIHGAAFVPPPAVGIFADVLLDNPFAAFIEELFNEGITSGCNTSPLRYCPFQNVTRAETAVFLLRAIHGAGFVPPAPTGIFADVPLAHPLVAWIEQLFIEGITSGCGTSPARYCPDNDITRAEMAVFLVRAFGLPL